MDTYVGRNKKRKRNHTHTFVVHQTFHDNGGWHDLSIHFFCAIFIDIFFTIINKGMGVHNPLEALDVVFPCGTTLWWLVIEDLLYDF